MCGGSALRREETRLRSLSPERQKKEVDFIRAAGKKCSKWLDDGRKHESGWFPL